jgi:microcystin-dependent protein
MKYQMASKNNGTGTNMAKRNTLRERLKALFVGTLLGVLIPTLALGQTATLLPNAIQRYTNDAGQPVALGTVTYYIPGTTTKKIVYQDGNATIPQTNPVLLDAGGKPQPAGQTYGSGCYQQVVKDASNVQIWSAVTCSTGSGGGGGSSATSIGDGLAVGTIIAWSSPSSIPTNYLYAYGQAVSRFTYSQLLSVLSLPQAGATCISSSTTLGGLTDTTQIPIGAPIEGTCIAPGTTVVSKTTNSVVMSIAATASLTITATFFPWGNGDGATTFQVPDLRGRNLQGRCNMGGTNCLTMLAQYFSGSGQTPNSLGAYGGEDSQTLVTAYLPSYTPSGTISGTAASGTNNIPTSTIAIQEFDANISGGGNVRIPANNPINSGTWSGVPSLTLTGSFAGTPQGGTSTPFSVVNPAATVNYAIKALPDTQARLNVTVLSASRLATTAALPANTYNNGTAGVGATLTATSNGALSIDSTAVASANQVLVKN